MGNKFNRNLNHKAQLTKEDFKSENLTNTPPSPSPTPNNELIQLFSVPVLVCPYTNDYSSELEWIKKQKYRVKDSARESRGLNHQSQDTFLLDKPELSRIRAFIEEKLDEYVTNIMGATNKVVITQSWLNKNAKNQWHHEHVHPNSMVSGVWYPLINEKSPPIKFKRSDYSVTSFDIKEFNNFNSATYMLPLRKGELILFPSNLEHMVPPNQSDEERISLSFNTWSKGDRGDIESLTYLPLDRCV